MFPESSAEHFSNAAILASVLKLTHDIESIALQHGLIKRTSPQDTKATLEALPLSRQKEILRDLEITLSLLQSMKRESDSRHSEINHLRSFLTMRNLRLGDEKFFDFIQDGDMIEVYDHRAIQIYRNWAFFEFCPYSLLELLVNDWNTLFVRPSWVIDRLIEMTPALFETGAKTMEYKFPEYLISARKQKGSPGLLFQMKYASPLIDFETGLPVAFVTTGRMRPAPETESGRNIDFI